MSIKAFLPYFWLGGDYIKTETLPDDTMVMPIQCTVDPEYTESMVCHSDSVQKWYILYKLNETKPGYDDVYYTLEQSGRWVDIAPYCCLGYIYAPFKWGLPVKSKYGLQYLPLWESVPTGKYTDDGCELTEEHYKLVTMIMTSLPDDNVTQHNDYTRFTITDYGTDLIQMTRDFECFTGIKY